MRRKTFSQNIHLHTCSAASAVSVCSGGAAGHFSSLLRFIRMPGIWLAMLMLTVVKLHAEQLFLVADDQPQAVVVTADEPSPAAAEAAAELVRHIEQATGVKLKTITESEAPDNNRARIFIGVTRAAEEAGIDVESLEPDEALIRSGGGDLFLLGREDREIYRGTFFAVYEFLERSLKVRWLWPGELGTYIPRTDVVTFSADMDVKILPAFKYRRIAANWQGTGYRSGEERDAYQQDYNAYLRRHRFGGPGHFGRAHCSCHSIRGMDDLFEEHPEWFALNEEDEREFRRGWCVSNPELHQYIADEYRKYLDGEEHGLGRFLRGEQWFGENKFLSLGDQDSSWLPCLCEECRSWDGPLPDNEFTEGLYDYFGRLGVSDRYARFYQKVYELVSELNPEVKVSGLVYFSYFPAPTTAIEISENVYGLFCPWGWGAHYVYFPMSTEAVEWKKQQWLGWKETGMSLFYRPNHWHGGYVMPHIEWQGAEFFQWAARNGMAGFHFDCMTDHWAVKGPVLYLYMRLFADPYQDIEGILKEFYNAFGPAADQVRKYFDYWKKHTDLISERDTRGAGDERLDLYLPANAAIAFPPDKFPPAREMLYEALAATRRSSREEYARRVEYLMIGLEHARLAARFWESMGRVSRRESKIPEEPEARRRAVEAFTELEAFRRRHGATSFVNLSDAEGRREARSADLDKLRQLQEKYAWE